MQPLIVRVENLQTRAITERAFTNSPVRVGRQEMSELCLDFPFVSQWHGLLTFDAESIHYIDLGSTNGTFIDGRRATKNADYVLREGTELRIGPLRVQISRVPAEQPLPPPPPLKSQFALQPVLPSIPARPAAPVAATRSAELKNVLEGLSGRFVEYRRTWSHLQDAIAAQLAPLSADERAGLLGLLQERYPELRNEPEFRALREAAGLTAPGAGSGAVGKAVERLARAYLPAKPPPSKDEETERFLERIALALESFSKALVEQRRGYDQFGQEMAVRTYTGDTPLHTSTQAKEVLAYLLDWTADSQARTEDLTRLFANLMMHQIALLNGVREGVRGLLGRLHAFGGETDARRGPLALLGAGRGAESWRRCEERLRELLEEESALSAEIFGKEFARAYATVAGQQPDAAPAAEAGGAERAGFTTRRFPG